MRARLELRWPPAHPPTATNPKYQVPPAGPTEVDLLLAFKATIDNGAEVLKSWVAGTDHCAWDGECGSWPCGVS